MYSLRIFDTAQKFKQRQPDGTALEVDGIETVRCKLYFEHIDQVTAFLSVYQRPVDKAIRWRSSTPTRETRWNDFVPMAKKEYANIQCADTLAMLEDVIQNQHQILEKRMQLLDTDPASVPAECYVIAIDEAVLLLHF